MPTWMHHFSIFSLKDCIELAVISFVFYRISHWLKRDTRKPLLLYFYGYCGLFIGAHTAHLQTLTLLLTVTTPLIALLFVFMHQDTLQKNFVSYFALQAEQPTHTNWPELMVRACLAAAGNQKDLCIVIQQDQQLDDVLTQTASLHAPLTQPLIDLMLSSALIKPETLLLVDRNGKLISYNSAWHESADQFWLSAQLKEQPTWVQDALFYSSKLDLIYLRIDTHTRLFTLINQGRMHTKIPAAKVPALITQTLNLFAPAKKGSADEYRFNTKKSSEQSLS